MKPATSKYPCPLPYLRHDFYRFLLLVERRAFVWVTALDPLPWPKKHVNVGHLFKIVPQAVPHAVWGHVWWEVKIREGCPHTELALLLTQGAGVFEGCWRISVLQASGIYVEKARGNLKTVERPQPRRQAQACPIPNSFLKRSFTVQKLRHFSGRHCPSRCYFVDHCGAPFGGII
jgi:hypothetical protein